MLRRAAWTVLLSPWSSCTADPVLCPESMHQPLNADSECVAQPLRRLAFGSCGHQAKPWPVIDVVLAHSPDLFLLLGDNLYGDTENATVLSQAYEMLGNHSDFKKLWQSSARVLATWDDHDFGWNDGGRNFPLKEQSKQLFLDFFREPSQSLRRERFGIYTSYSFGPIDQRVQVILLDLRTFRDDLKPWKGDHDLDVRDFYYVRPFAPFGPEDGSPDLLGESQWTWLEQQLSIPARVRFICTSTQFGITANGYESWANFPHEIKRMQTLIEKTQASGVVFLSGDVHYSEISQLSGGSYPLFDFTSSGLSQTWAFATPNSNRVAGPVMENNIGMVDIELEHDHALVRLRTITAKGETRLDSTIRLGDMSANLILKS